VPRVELPHPVAGMGGRYMQQVADDVAPAIVAALQGSS